MSLEGFTSPRTPEGRSSLVPRPPWHYVGAFLVIDYWADPEKAVAFLPEGIDPHPDPGRCAFVAADGRRCNSRRFVQMDHIITKAGGGAFERTNVRLLCGPHNRLMAERAFGTEPGSRHAGGTALAWADAVRLQRGRR